jgi:CRP-like cAMP-binding protein
VPEAELELLRRLPVFAPLPPVALEQVATHLSRVHFRAGDAVFRQGDHGDSFYVVVDGEVMVAPTGRPAVTLGPGDSFGEIALLRDVPRTATVIARTDAELLALERDVFIAAVTGHAPSAEAADAVIATHLGSAVQPL